MKKPMSIQWHITTKCQNHCKHCYLYDEATYGRECSGHLPLEGKIRILDQLEAFGEKWGFSFPDVFVIGGDPLLEDDCFPFLEELKKRGKRISMGGNADELTDENLARLKEIGVTHYQMSLDGMRRTHDLTRRPGSFAGTIEGFSKLAEYGISGGTMATLTPLNVDEFFELLDFVVNNTKARSFGFDFVAKVGNGKNLIGEFTPQQVLDLSKRYLDLKEKYSRTRPDISLGEKPGPFRMLQIARGERVPIDDGEKTCFSNGCLIGRDCLCILSDGTILSCRRFPEIVGKLPEDSIEDILLGNETLKKYRRPQFWKDCGSCMGWNICRGCPAISYGECGDPFVKPSYCFAHLLGFDTYQEHEPVPMDTTYEEEAEFIKNSYPQKYAELLSSRKINPGITRMVMELAGNDDEYKVFAENPEAYFEKNGQDFSPEDRKLTIFRLNNARS